MAAPADTSSEAAKKYKERFRKETSEVVVRTLDPYHKVEATTGRIKNKEDFKYLAKKVSLRFFSINFHSPPMVPPLCMDYGNNRIIKTLLNIIDNPKICFSTIFLLLTNYIVEKELSHCPKLKDLKCNEAKKKKIESYVRKHMSKFGEEGYKRED